METPALQTERLTKIFRKEKRSASPPAGVRRWLPKPRTQSRVVDSVSLTIEKREIFGVLGPNGSGKSTLIRIISTLLLPDEGTAKVFGHDVVKEPDTVRRMIARVSADAAFFRPLSAMENLVHAAMLYDIPYDVARDRIKEILGRLDLRESKMNTPMQHLSRGMQQKVAITRAFLTSPVLMLLDEPTTGLDPKSKREVQKFIREIRDENDATVLLTTHDMEEAEKLCDRIAIIDAGKIVALDTPAGLKESVTKDGKVPTMEEVFFALSGKTLEEAEQEDRE